MVKLLLVDIDGLRSDVFVAAVASGRAPNISRLMGGADFECGIHVPVLAPAPSITFCSQASLFTGAHPSQHGIPGNQYFDRFGTQGDGKPRHFAFDVGDTLAVDDAVRVFTHGLASDCLRVPTIYERFSDWGWQSVVAGNMYAKGADIWIKPSLTKLARFTKGGNLFGMKAPEYDRHILEQSLDLLDEEGLPDLLTLYLMGMDHESHHSGPEIQMDYLADTIDPIIGSLWDFILTKLGGSDFPLVAFFSDHGQIRVVPDDRHSIRLAFPFEREMGYLFDALGLDVHDFPGEDPSCNAVVASNGGLAHVYLRKKRSSWSATPSFVGDVLPVGKAFWEAHKNGRYALELEGSLWGVLVRNVEAEGLYAPYHALTPGGSILSLNEWFQGSGNERVVDSDRLYADPIHRLDNLVSPFVGDLLLVSNYGDGYYFCEPLTGVHGGLHPEDSGATLAYGWPGIESTKTEQLRTAVIEAINTRCRNEAGRQPSTADLLTGLLALL